MSEVPDVLSVSAAHATGFIAVASRNSTCRSIARVPGLPLSTPLSQLLVAFTIEFDNELDHRLTAADVGRRLPISMVMWSNFMRFVGDGITVGELPDAAGIPKSRTLSTLGGMERWRYVFVSPSRPACSEVEARRLGERSGAAARVVRPPHARRPEDTGDRAAALRRDGGALGAAVRDRLNRRATPGAGHRDRGSSKSSCPSTSRSSTAGTGCSPRSRTANAAQRTAAHLSARLAQALLAYTLDFERTSELSLPLTANFVRVLGDAGLDVRELPATAGVSPGSNEHGSEVPGEDRLRHGRGEARPPHGKGPGGAGSRSRPPCDSRESMEQHVGYGRRCARSSISAKRSPKACSPYPDGWRARKSYVEQTNAVIADPTGRLPHYPMVLHRGGWPDGS